MQIIVHGVSWEALSPSYFRNSEAQADVFYGGMVAGWRIHPTGERHYLNAPFLNRDHAMEYVANRGKGMTLGDILEDFS